MKTKMVLTFQSLLRAFCQKSSQVSWKTQNCGMSWNASNGGTLGPRTSDHASAQAALHPTFDPLALQRQNPDLSYITCVACMADSPWNNSMRLPVVCPNPVKNSTYMFRDSCLKQAEQDRQIEITTCTWLEVLHSGAVQDRDFLSKMLSNNVLSKEVWMRNFRVTNFKKC